MTLRRREFIKASLTVAGAAALRTAMWERLFAAPVTPGPSPYGPLLAPDHLGLRLPAGFTSRIIARSGLPVDTSSYVWPIFPDGAHCFPTSHGGWVHVVNSETPSTDSPIPDPPQRLGAASAIRFDSAGRIVGAHNVLRGTRTNCAGGATPWGTWLSCEEFDDSIRGGATASAGKVWECNPFVKQPGIRRDALGAFKHEAAAVDPATSRVYMTEDVPDGCFYRFTPASFTGGPSDLAAGTLAAAKLTGPSTGPWSVIWLPIPDPSAASVSTRYQIPATTPFDGGEGCFFDSGIVYFTTKGDDRVWRYHVGSETLDILYDASDHVNPPLTGVDNVIVSSSGDVLVAEDGGNMEICIITPDNRIARLLRATGFQHGFDSPSPIPTRSEITGLAFSPNGKRLYFNSQRGYALGITYEVKGPFRT